MDLIRVVLADDEPAVRESIATILASDPRISVVAVTESGPAAVTAVARERPDLVLLDIRMPGGNGLDAAKRIRSIRPDQVVVVLTTFGEAAYIDRAMALGLNGFLLKTADPFEIINGVRAAVAGGVCLSPLVAARLVRQIPRGHAVTSARHKVINGLTPREHHLLMLLARGNSNAEIAAELYLTEDTVKGYVSALFQRLNVRNRVEAALIAYKTGMICGD